MSFTSIFQRPYASSRRSPCLHSFFLPSSLPFHLVIAPPLTHSLTLYHSIYIHPNKSNDLLLPAISSPMRPPLYHPRSPSSYYSRQPISSLVLPLATPHCFLNLLHMQQQVHSLHSYFSNRHFLFSYPFSSTHSIFLQIFSFVSNGLSPPPYLLSLLATISLYIPNKKLPLHSFISLLIFIPFHSFIAIAFNVLLLIHPPPSFSISLPSISCTFIPQSFLHLPLPSHSPSPPHSSHPRSYASLTFSRLLTPTGHRQHVERDPPPPACILRIRKSY